MSTTLDQGCRALLQGDPTRQAIAFQDAWFLWGDVGRVAERVTTLLDQAGLPAGAPVALVPRNRPSAVAAELGLVAAGRTIAMVYAFQSAAGIARDVGRLEMGAVIAAAEDLDGELLQVARDKGMAAIALTEMDAVLVAGAERVADPSRHPAAPRPEIRIHTSGTTGAPKHVGFSFETINKYIVGQNITQAFPDNNAEPPPTLAFYPLGNISGIYTVFPSMMGGRRLQLLDRFSLDAWRAYVRQYQPAIAGVPAGGIRMILDAEVPKEELASLKVMPTGAAPLDPTVQRAFEERYGIPILLSYGATEFGGPVSLMTPDDYAEFGAAKLGSVGRPYAGARLQVIDPDTGAVLPSGQEGLLEVMAPRIGTHWIRTTDIGMIDADGFLYLRGRADGAIVRGGFKLLPDVIEQALCLHPAVASASVVGVPDPRLGQVPAACVQLKPNHPAPPIPDLEQHLRQHVYATHIPTRWAFVEAIPRNATFKVDLAGVRALFASEAVQPAV